MKKRLITRKQFLTTITAGAGTVLIGNRVEALSFGRIAKNTDPFSTITLGKTGIQTTLLGMGTGFNGYNRSSSIIRAGVAESVIRAAYEKGIRFFDCADQYGTHPYTAAGLKGIPREKYTIGTKVSLARGGLLDSDQGSAVKVVDRFRKELNTEYIDFVQLHCLMSGSWNDEHKQFMDELETLKARKIIRAHGVSVHSLEALRTAASNPWVDIIHVRINPFGASMDTRDPAVVVPLIEQLHNSGKGVIGMKLIGNGSYKDDSDKIDQSIKFVLNLGTVDLLIVGFEKPEQIDNYVTRMKNIVL